MTSLNGVRPTGKNDFELLTSSDLDLGLYGLCGQRDRQTDRQTDRRQTRIIA